MKSFAERLVTLRKARGLTQQALAKLSGLSVLQIKRYESKQGYLHHNKRFAPARPSLESLAALAVALKVTADDLVFEDATRTIQDDVRERLEMLASFGPQEMELVGAVLEGLILRHNLRKS